jgi:hypothetical protein
VSLVARVVRQFHEGAEGCLAGTRMQTPVITRKFCMKALLTLMIAAVLGGCSYQPPSGAFSPEAECARMVAAGARASGGMRSASEEVPGERESPASQA